VLVSYYINVGTGIQHIAGTVLQIDPIFSSAPPATLSPR
jgi:hypothetical protein